MVVKTQLMTAEELFKMPDDGFKYELVDGILRRMSPTGKRHGKVTVSITSPLDQHVRSNRLGEVYGAETGFIIASNPDRVLAPDVSFVSSKRVEEIGDIETFIPGAPDLVVEVVSPSDSFSDVEEKVWAWLEAGARMVIVANPRKKTLTIYRTRTHIKVLTIDDSLSGDDVVPGWELPVKNIFD